MSIEQDIKEIIKRNERVEADKAWETSWTRALVIATMTYIVALVWLNVVGNPAPWLNACIPAIGFLFSTFSLPIVKRRWIEKNQNRK